MSHTKEPMFQYEFRQLATYENGRTPVLLTEEQYRRARACVNACAGIDTELLEQTNCWAEAGIESVTSLRKQRDELIAELINAATYHRSHECYSEASRVESFVASMKGGAA